MKNKRASFVLPDHERDLLKRLAKIADRSEAEIVRSLIRWAAKKKGLAAQPAAVARPPTQPQTG